MKEAIQHLKDRHPYPEDVFIPAPDEAWDEIRWVLDKHQMSHIRIFGHMARIGYESAIAKLEDL